MTDHTETQIPNDVMEAAVNVAFEIYADADNNKNYTWFDVRDVIARAILAERERCARIADEYKKQLEGEANEWRADRMPMAAGQADAQAKASSTIASKIRSVDK